MVCSFDLSQCCWKHLTWNSLNLKKPPMKPLFCEWSHSSVQDPPEVLPGNLTAAIMAYNCLISNPHWVAPHLHHPSSFCLIQTQTLLWMKFCQAADLKACIHFKVKYNGFIQIPEFKIKFAFTIWLSATNSY